MPQLCPTATANCASLAIPRVGPLMGSKRGLGRASGAGSAYPRQSESRAFGRTVATTSGPTAWPASQPANTGCLGSRIVSPVFVLPQALLRTAFAWLPVSESRSLAATPEPQRECCSFVEAGTPRSHGLTAAFWHRRSRSTGRNELDLRRGRARSRESALLWRFTAGTARGQRSIGVRERAFSDVSID